MRIQPRFFVNKNGINKLALFLLCCLSANVSFGMFPFLIDFSVTLKDPTLSIYSIPVQNAQANSNFNFNISPYISVIEPEVDYLVTNNMYIPFGNLTAHKLPPGVRRIYDGDEVCAERFSLEFKQSCTLRFIVNLNEYMRPWGDIPVICGDFVSKMCPRPDQYNNFTLAVARLTGPTIVDVKPQFQDGLSFDQSSLSILGRPTRTGVYVFLVIAKNDYSTTEPRVLQIDVGVNLRDKPVFKTTHNIASAMPEQNYHINLVELIEPTPGLMVNNQISFSIDTSKEYPAWLSINGGTILQGHVPPEEAGKHKKVTIIASSNTGGQSEPLTITIPVAYDPAKKPVIDKNFKIFGEAGRIFRSDLRMKIVDPVSDSSLKIVVDQIEPLAPWLKVSSYEPTKLEGVIPEESVGTEYQITMHANTETGGNSDSVTIPLQVAINERLTPRFYAANPQFPMVYEGQPFFYDFVENHDISPEYSDIPFQVELADGYKNPSWLRLEDNKLIADVVPGNLYPFIPLFITIKNQPGGKSQMVVLQLRVMN